MFPLPRVAVESLSASRSMLRPRRRSPLSSSSWSRERRPPGPPWATSRTGPPACAVSTTALTNSSFSSRFTLPSSSWKAELGIPTLFRVRAAASCESVESGQGEIERGAVRSAWRGINVRAQREWQLQVGQTAVNEASSQPPFLDKFQTHVCPSASRCHQLAEKKGT